VWCIKEGFRDSLKIPESGLIKLRLKEKKEKKGKYLFKFIKSIRIVFTLKGVT